MTPDLAKTDMAIAPPTASVPGQHHLLLLAAIVVCPLSSLLAGGLLLVYWAGQGFRFRPRQAFFPRHERWLWWGFIAASLLTGLVAWHPPLHYAGLFTHYLLYAFFTLLFLTTLARERVPLPQAFACSGALLAIVALGNYLLGWTVDLQWLHLPVPGQPALLDFQLPPPVDGAGSFAMNPNTLGTYLALALPLTAWWLAEARQGGKQGLIAGLLVLQLLGLAFSFSRGAWLGAGLGGLWLLLHVRGRGKWAFLALPGLLLLIPALRENLVHIFDPAYSTNESRLQIWQSGWHMLRDAPWTGIGILNFEAAYPFYRLNLKPAAHLHNLYLQTLVESGVLAGSLWLLLLGSWLKDSFRFRSGPGLYLNAALFVFLLACLFDYTLADVRIGFFICGVLAFKLYYRREIQDPSQSSLASGP